MTGRDRLTCLVLATALAGCGATGPASPLQSESVDDRSSVPAATPPQVPAASHGPTAIPVPTTSPSHATPPPAPTVSPPTASPAGTATPPVTFEVGDTALVVADAVRAHNDHSVEAARFSPMLAKGTSMLILEGPRLGSGYHWYRVALINATLTRVSGAGPDDTRGLSVWVPVASRDGEAWVRAGKARCPPTPGSVLELYSVPMGARLTCFGGVPVSVTATIVRNDEGCDYDPGMAIRPTWFGGAGIDMPDGSSRALMLATPAGVAPDPPCPPFETLLYLDPAGTRPDPLPLERRVTVTGMFDHPAAATCRWKWGEEPWQATDACRYWFVATTIVR